MPKFAKPLTDAEVRHKREAGCYAVGGPVPGLYLRVTVAKESGRINRAWVYRFQQGGKRRTITLGHFPTMTLKEARAASLAKSVDGGNLLASPVQSGQTFADYSESVIVDEAVIRKRPDAYAADWRAKFENHVYGKKVNGRFLSDTPIAEIGKSHVDAVLRPIWQTRPDLANRVKIKLKFVIGKAIANDLHPGPCPVESVAKRLPSQPDKPAENFQSIPWRDLPTFFARLPDDDIGRCLRFIILTGARSGEARDATADELTSDEHGLPVWIIPAARIKTGKKTGAFRVPLTDAALSCLPDNPAGRLFPKAGNPHRLLDTARACWPENPSITVHGFRSALRTWAADEYGVAMEVGETLLNHRLTKVQRAYMRGDALDLRRAVLDAWADWCLNGTHIATP